MPPNLDSPIDVGLIINGEPKAIQLPCSVRELLHSLDLDRTRVAVAINRDVIPRSTFDSHPLASGDRIEILEAVGGG